MNFGIRVNLGQFLQQLLQVLFVGMTIGMMRNGAAAAVCGLGMAMLYPNLSAAVADIAHPSWRA